MTKLIICKLLLYSTVELNLSLDSKAGFLNVGLSLYFKVPNSQKYWKLGFVNFAVVGLLNIYQFMKEMECWDFWMLAKTVDPNFS